MRKLGYDMLSRGQKGDIHVLMTHTHWDHIQGWPFFGPGFFPNNRVHFYSCHANCRERFIRQQYKDYFPINFEDMASKRDFFQFQSGDSFDIESFHVSTLPLMHPGGSIAYKIVSGGKQFVFATDTEFFGPDLEKQIEDRRDFFEGVDLLVMDAQYSLAEAEQKIGWGHTAMLIAVDCAVHWKVGRLVLTHHEPAHNDAKTFRLYEEAVAYKNKQALEGATYDL